MDLQLIPIPSLDFQVALNLGETAPLIIYWCAVLLSSFTRFVSQDFSVPVVIYKAKS